MKTVFTRNEAADIVELFEDVLVGREISVLSDEDDDRDEDDTLGLYGSTYWDLVDNVESLICVLLTDATGGTTDVKKAATDIVEMFKDVLDGSGLSVPEVSGQGEKYSEFLGEVEAALAALLRWADGAEIVSDEFGDEIEYEASKTC